MQKLCQTIAVFVLTVLLSGCTHTVVGNGNGVLSPDGRFRLRVETHGASGKAYVDMSKKRVFVLIWTKPEYWKDPERVFYEKDVFRGADMRANVQWEGSQNVLVRFYDFGDRVSVHDTEKANAASNQVATLPFFLDTKTGKFKEKK
jgi:alkylated DNA repair dioxygenase AlkB